MHTRIPFYVGFLFLICLGFWACKEEFTPASGPSSNQDIWRISTDFIFDGGVGKEGIPTVDAPVFKSVAEIDYLADEDLVLVLKVGDQIRVYPHAILDYHEVVNDQIGTEAIAITYCPLTGTGLAWNRTIDGHVTSFGGSGLIYNSNLMPYDRATESYWSQMLMRSVKGEHNGMLTKNYSMIEMPWAMVKARFTKARVLTTNTGFTRAYEQYPYLDYRTNPNFLLFPVEFTDDSRNGKERLLGVEYLGEVKLYPFTAFEGEGTKVFIDGFKGNRLVLIGSAEEGFMMAYQNRLDNGQMLEFTVFEDDPEIVMTDDKGNGWNIFGEAVSGPDTGARLKPINVFMGFWFAWAAFYPFSEVYSG